MGEIKPLLHNRVVGADCEANRKEDAITNVAASKWLYRSICFDHPQSGQRKLRVLEPQDDTK